MATDPRVLALQQQAALLKAQNDLADQQARALAISQQVAGMLPPTPPPAPKTPAASAWAQDNMGRPYNSMNAHEDSFLKSFDRMNACFPFQFPVTSAGGSWFFVIPVELTRNFWISNVLSVAWTTATQAFQNQRAGYVSLFDNATNNCFLSNVQLNMLFTLTTQPAVRMIWPRPYPIGAGGSCTVRVDVPVTASLPDCIYEIRVEGFWDFSHVT